jgi:hypothetical protein
VPKKAPFTHERVEYVFLFDEPLKGSKSLNSILSIKNGNDNVRIEDNCLEEELATTPILSEIRTLSLTFVMLI